MSKAKRNNKYSYKTFTFSLPCEPRLKQMLAPNAHFFFLAFPLQAASSPVPIHPLSGSESRKPIIQAFNQRPITVHEKPLKQPWGDITLTELRISILHRQL